MRKIFLLLLFVSVLFASVNAGVKFDFEDKSFSLFERIVAEGTQVQEKPAFFFSSPYDDLIFKLKTNSDNLVEDKQKVKIVTKSKSFIERKNGLIKLVTEKRVPVEVVITEEIIGLKPIEVKVNQPVVWKNEQKRLQSLIYGMREISAMKSDFIEPGESFTWSFSEPGEYVYVDSVVIGRTGKIIVNP
jgi:hypothetical protein